ncbi:hypothetical protein F5I97DRAFT_929872 [Phlebopus sp. FC_14]|nr:hypothetical protein F5I97DRAFT_929872 [Phlebopus sp. FC_14]
MGLHGISAAQPLQVQALSYCQVAATVLVLYDHAINMESEVDLIWIYHKEKSSSDSRKRFDLMMMMILATRYFGEGVLIFSIGGFSAPWAGL